MGKQNHSNCIFTDDDLTSSSSDTDWANRSAFWLDQTPKQKPKRVSSRKWKRFPLALTGHGVRLRVEKGALCVTDGFTHYPQKRDEFRFFPGDWRVPSRIVILDSKGSVSLDALAWLSSQSVPLVQVDWSGHVVTVAGGGGYSADPDLVKAQLAALANQRWVELLQHLISEKIANSIQTLSKAFPRSPAIDIAIKKLHREANLMRNDPPSTVNEFRGVEGGVGYAYFSAWHSFPLRWKGVNRNAIPEDWRRIGQRQSHLSPNARHATHPVNAMLNYAYGMLESQVHTQVVAAGLDPTVGYLHACQPGRLALVYDLMEPLRPLLDRRVLGFIRNHEFAPADFTITKRGACRLNPLLARSLVKSADESEFVSDFISTILSELLPLSRNRTKQVGEFCAS